MYLPLNLCTTDTDLYRLVAQVPDDINISHHLEDTSHTAIGWLQRFPTRQTRWLPKDDCHDHTTLNLVIGAGIE